MSNVRNGVRNNSQSSYWRHLRKIGKRFYWKRHRKQLKLATEK
jgi:hypothetical protein